MRDGLTRQLPGLGLAALGAALGWLTHLLLPAVPWLTASLILGVVAGSVPAFRTGLDGPAKPGLATASRRLLRLGIVLLGLQLSLGDIAALGWVTVLGVVALVAAAFGITWLIARLLRLPGDEPLLLAAGFSICGVSAIGAMSAARGSRDEEAGVPVALVTLYGTAALVILPALSALLGLDAITFGRWTGASVHDVGQVVATAQTAGAAALAVAVVVKLARVLLLAPIVAVTALATRRSQSRGAEPTAARPAIVPLFIVGFAALVLVRSFLPVPEAVIATASAVQSALLAAALFGIGASLRLERLLRSGARAILAGGLSWLAILAMALPLALAA